MTCVHFFITLLRNCLTIYNQLLPAFVFIHCLLKPHN